MTIKMEKKLVYCPICEAWVKPARKTFDHVYHELLCFMIVLTMGIGFFVYLILKYRKKRNRCPNCETILDLTQIKTIREMEMNHLPMN